MKLLIALLFFSSFFVIYNKVLADSCAIDPGKLSPVSQTCEDVNQTTFDTKTSFDSQGNMVVQFTPKTTFSAPSGLPTSPIGAMGFMPQMIQFTDSSGTSLPPINLPSLPNINLPQVSIDELLTKQKTYIFTVPQVNLPPILQKPGGSAQITVTSQPIDATGKPISIDATGKPTDYSWANCLLKISGNSCDPANSKIDQFTKDGLVQSLSKVTLQTQAQTQVQAAPQPAVLSPSPLPTLPPVGAGPVYCDFDDNGKIVKYEDLATLTKKGHRHGILSAIGCVPTDPVEFIKGVLKLIAQAGGAVALLLMFAGFFKMITSGGDEKNLHDGQEQVQSAIIGLLFVIFSVLLLQIIGVQILDLPGFK